MTRAGRLPTDPAVQAMTPMQWRLTARMYHLQDRVEEERRRLDDEERERRSLTAIIRVLGLDLLDREPPSDTPEHEAWLEREKSGVPSFTPASLLWTHPRLLHALRDRMMPVEGAESDVRTRPDASFAEFSSNLHDVLSGRADASVLGEYQHVLESPDPEATRQRRLAEQLAGLNLPKATEEEMARSPRVAPRGRGQDLMNDAAWAAFERALGDDAPPSDPDLPPSDPRKT